MHVNDQNKVAEAAHDLIVRVFARLNEQVQETGKKSQIGGIFNYELAMHNEPYLMACEASYFLFCALEGIITGCPNCGRKLAFDLRESYPLKKCHCRKVLKLQKTNGYSAAEI